MTTSRRRDIVNYLVTQLKTITTISDIDSFLLGEDSFNLLTEDDLYLSVEQYIPGEEYAFKTTLSTNVFKGLKYLDQINDFPSIYIQAGVENYIYNSKTNTQGAMELMIRVYAYSENSSYTVEDIVEDVTHVLENIKFNQEHRIISSEIMSIDTDSGLLDPYGLGEIKVLVQYDLDD